MHNYLFKEKIEFEDDYIVLREPTILEVDGLSEDNDKNMEILKSIFCDCIVDSSFTNDDGTKADTNDVYEALIQSGSLFVSILAKWISTIPFQASETESIEIRQVCKLLFSGDNPMSMPETKDLFYKYKTLIESFLVSVDKRTGSLLHLPFDTDLLNQPSKTMSFYRIMQNLYVESVRDSLKFN